MPITISPPPNIRPSVTSVLILFKAVPLVQTLLTANCATPSILSCCPQVGVLRSQHVPSVISTCTRPKAALSAHLTACNAIIDSIVVFAKWVMS